MQIVLTVRKKMSIDCIAAGRLQFLVLSGLLKLSCIQSLYRLQRILETKNHLTRSEKHEAYTSIQCSDMKRNEVMVRVL